MYNEIIVKWLAVRDFSGCPVSPAGKSLAESLNYQEWREAAREDYVISPSFHSSFNI
jgi:hypothetical protein